jgi:nucleoside-triphosphatase THEP1
METLHVHIWGGPSMGKTGVAQLVSGELKRHGYQADYVPEYAKELVRSGIIHLYDQLEILAEQYRREKVNHGLLQVVVTDSPLPLSLYHAAPQDRDYFEKIIDNRIGGWNVVNYLVERNIRESYETEGRYETVDQALTKHEALKGILERRDPHYITLETASATDAIFADIVSRIRSAAPHTEAA